MPAAADILRQHGLSVTTPRLAVLRVVAKHPHLTAEDLAEMVRAETGAVSRQSVYNVLALFAEKGLLRRIEPAGSPARYEDRVGDNHHHIVCRQCGRMVDVDCAIGHAPCLSPKNDHGFLIDEAEVTYWGLCPECQSIS